MIVFVWREIKICFYYRLRLQLSLSGRSLKPRAVKYQEHETWHEIFTKLLISHSLLIPLRSAYRCVVDIFTKFIKKR